MIPKHLNRCLEGHTVSIGMTLWVIILFSLPGVLRGNVLFSNFEEIRLTTVDECCQDGRNRGDHGQDCTIIPNLSSSHMCRIAQERCCSAAREKLLCNNGVTMALYQGACEVPFFEGEPWEAKLSKICCDCCTLGLIATRDTLSCDFRHLYLNAECSDTAKECCLNKTEASKTDPMMADPEVTAKPPVNCTGSPCSHFCRDNGTCGCFSGFQLKDDGVNCEDIDECVVGTHNCFQGLACINMEGSFLCRKRTSCEPGYELKSDNKCQDLDECTLGTHNCGANFLCTNTPGSFQCSRVKTCPAGFIEDAPGSCADINECVAQSSPCQRGETCVNTDGSFDCRRNRVTCGRGYHLSQDGTRCEDMDECETGNVCGDHGCLNLVGTYRCECREGFFFNEGTKRCKDVNECRYYQGVCAHKCENTKGSYRCSCTSGFQLSNDGANCDDLDECLARPCSQNCVNVYGSYWCHCHPGYQLSDTDGITCEDVDECALPSGVHTCSYMCTNIPGSYYCSCPPDGYILAPNGQTCQDIDECAAGIHTCSASDSCFNIQGGFRCLSFTCPEDFQEVARGSKKDHLVFVRCMKHCRPHDQTCQSDLAHLITYTSLSLPTITDLTEPEDIIYMQTSTAFKTSPQSDATDIFFDIIFTDAESSFEAHKRAHQGMIMGVIQQVKPIIGPMDLVLQVAVNYVKSGLISHYNTVFIYIFISD
ncbi:fibulin-1 isoform X1 [Takifugu rubripes]|uniref:Fibulin-1 n=1 Tax=Takifugu rubripes TaxID=31033 RepID=H2SNB6_TAKRU|nr:fibulin-1 isoform X1 [Takifugu rubripes]XP_011611781.2 fibulin-1 isoform X1 [Takifugu rubripes]